MFAQSVLRAVRVGERWKQGERTRGPLVWFAPESVTRVAAGPPNTSLVVGTDESGPRRSTTGRLSTGVVVVHRNGVRALRGANLSVVCLSVVRGGRRPVPGTTLRPPSSSVAAWVGQQCHLPGVLDRGGYLALLSWCQARYAAGADLAAVGDELSQQRGVLPVHRGQSFLLQQVALPAWRADSWVHQLALLTPGSSPRWAISRSRNLDRPNARK
jgi:hypothetical protein